MQELTLIQCTNSKRSTSAFAHNLYDESAYYRKMRSWAQSRECPWRILSAKYGLLHPGTEIEPYDERGLSDAQAEEIASQLHADGVDAVRVCAGREYLDPLTPALEAHGIDVVDPFAGLRIGERMRELGERANA